jgi:hypothetical protein
MLARKFLGIDRATIFTPKLDETRAFFEKITVIHKRPEVSTEEIRDFMEHPYGPTYVAIAIVDAADGAEPTIDAIVPIAFDSKEDVAFALASEAYRDAAQLRKAFMQVTSRGIHPPRIARTVKPV